MVASVARLLAKTPGLLVEDVGDVGLGEKGEDGDEADSGEDCEMAEVSGRSRESVVKMQLTGKDPKDPPPVGAGHIHVARDDGSEGGSGEGHEGEDGEGITTLVGSP